MNSEKTTLDQQLDEFFSEENKNDVASDADKNEENQEDIENEVEDSKELEEKGKDSENEAEEEKEDEETAEDEKKELTENEEREIELNKKLSGFPKEFRELVKSVENEELQNKILEAGKVTRAREDRLSLELGNLKKEYSNFLGLMQFLDANPQEAIKHIAKSVKVDLDSLIEKKPVQEDDEIDFRTSEEIERDKKLKELQDEINSLKNHKKQEEMQAIVSEIDFFANETDKNGDLKYPFFEKVQDSITEILTIQNSKLGFAKNAQERNSRLKTAYEKAILLDDEVRSQREEEILKKAEEKRLQELEKAKRLKKLSSKSSFNLKSASKADVLGAIYDKYMN